MMKSRHSDFERIHTEFCDYYGTSKGDREYYDWLHALSVDESKPYGAARESFQWCRDMLKLVSEDAENKYYGVLVSLPIMSMNGNIYHERDLIAAATTVIGKSPSMNHKDEFWLSTKNPRNRWGPPVTVERSKFSDGANEVVLKVPRATLCPVCEGNKPLYQLIDERKIVNVSLEGKNSGGAFEYTDPPFTLLTSDVLPGIPLARIKPLEKILSEAFTGTKLPGKEKMKVAAQVKEDSNQKITQPATTVNTRSMSDPDFKGTWGTPLTADAAIDTQTDNAKTVLGTPAYADNTNLHVNGDTLSSISHEEQCPEGSMWDAAKGQCVPVETEPMEAVDNSTDMPKPEDIRSGPSRNKAPERSVPAAGSLPGIVKPSNWMGTAPVGAGNVVTGTSPVGESLPSLEERRGRIQAELYAKDAEAKAIAWEQKHNEAYTQLQTKTAAYNELSKQFEALRSDVVNERNLANQKIENTIIRMEKAINDYNQIAGDKLKLEQKFQDLTAAFNDVNKKYNEKLQDNLSLSQKVTKANEDYLDVAKRLENTTEALERSRIKAKDIIKIKV